LPALEELQGSLLGDHRNQYDVDFPANDAGRTRGGEICLHFWSWRAVDCVARFSFPGGRCRVSG
jgi:hypothetical protein